MKMKKFGRGEGGGAHVQNFLKRGNDFNSPPPMHLVFMIPSLISEFTGDFIFAVDFSHLCIYEYKEKNDEI